MDTNILALKYRPTKFADLIGQDSVTTTLTNAFNSKDLYQCYIFEGMYGCGKTTAGRILAAMENCDEGPTLEPCGKCKMCRDIFSGQSSDIKEVNAASDTGIDVIRNIADFVSNRPLSARVKYVLLDEMHALSRQALESALKLFEEPPENVRYVLCTTDAHKLKGTIHSRAMSFRFSKVPWPQMTEYLSKIAQMEKISIDEQALKCAAKTSQGSVRNALRNLQLLVNFSNKQHITADLAQKALGSVSSDLYFGLMDSILGKDATSGIKAIQAILDSGASIDMVISGISEHLRNLMVLLSCQNTAGILYLTEDEKKKYVHQIQRMSIVLVTDVISLLYDVSRGLTVNLSPQMLLEQFAIKAMMCVAKLEREKKT